MSKDIYIVRAIEDRQLVCFAAVEPILGEMALSEYVDEFHTVRLCEYALIDELSIGWPGRAPAWPEYFTGTGESDIEDFSSPPLLSDVMQNGIEDLQWSRFGEGYIYFVRLNFRIKIGYSTNVKARLKTLQVSSPDPLEFIGSRPGSMRDEERLHSKYADLHASGEWFNDIGVLTRDLCALLSHPDFQTDKSTIRAPYRYRVDY